MSVGPVARDAATAPFFDGTARGELLLRRCPDGHWSEPAASVCSACRSADLGWAPSSGRATLVSWAVVHEPTPVVAAIVEMAEGPWWWTQLDVADPTTLRAGDALTVELRRAGDDHEAVPVFVPAG